MQSNLDEKNGFSRVLSGKKSYTVAAQDVS